MDSADSVTCPHCGADLRDLSDYDWPTTYARKEISCDECGESFTVARDVWVTYEVITEKESVNG